MKHILILAAEITLDLPEATPLEQAAAVARQRLDAFRESALPSEHGICLFTPTAFCEDVSQLVNYCGGADELECLLENVDVDLDEALVERARRVDEAALADLCALPETNGYIYTAAERVCRWLAGRPLPE